MLVDSVVVSITGRPCKQFLLLITKIGYEEPGVDVLIGEISGKTNKGVVIEAFAYWRNQLW